jgi:APA family basic amino acid/polyamine antiporter
MGEPTPPPEASATDRRLGYPTLLAVTYASVAGGLYLLLGPIVASALGATPIVVLAAAVLFALAAMSYVEAASIHPERGGAPTFARHGLDELWSFATAWALLLDSILLTAAATLAATNYLAAIWSEAARGWVELAIAALILTAIAMRAIRGGVGGLAFAVRRLKLTVAVDVALQAGVVVLGLVLLFDPDALVDTIAWSNTGDWQGVLFALGITMIAVIGLESAAALAGDVPIGRRDLRRLVRTLPLLMVLLYGGVATVGLMAMPVQDGATPLGDRWIDAPILGIVHQLGDSWAIDALAVVVGVVAAATLIGMALASLGGAGRNTVQLSLHRQLPTRLGRLHPEHGTPRLVLIVVAVVAAGLVALRDLEFLVGTMAFGVMLATTVAHIAVVRLRYVEPDAPRPYLIPGNVRFRGGLLPIPAVVGAVLSAAVWVSVVVSHPAARTVGFAWLAIGLIGYVAYRRYHDLPVRGRISVPEKALRGEESTRQYGSILVPLLGSGLDDDVVQTAGRLAGGDDETDPEEGYAVIEAVWIHVLPMASPIDGPIPDTRRDEARTALARARAVGEEYDGVRVATSAVRARSVGSAIVNEAKRRGCEAIVMVAPPPTISARRRAGTSLGARGGDRFVLGDAARYVIAKAPCQVILTAPSLDETDAVIRRRREARDELEPADELTDEDEQWLRQL